MTRKTPPAPAPADASAIAAALDELVRDVLPETLEERGFAELADRVRHLEPITPTTDAGALRSLARTLRAEIYAEAAEYAEAASGLEDELERLRARVVSQSPRFTLAANACGLVLEVAGAWALTLDEYRPGLTRDQLAEIALRQIEDVRRMLAK